MTDFHNADDLTLADLLSADTAELREDDAADSEYAPLDH